MYDPNLDAEERLRKIAIQELLANNKAMTADITPTLMPAPAVPPPEVPGVALEDRIIQGLANYQGMAPINPVGVQPIHRGGGLLAPTVAEMDTDMGGGGILDAITQGNLGSSSNGSEGPQDWPDFFQKLLQNNLKKWLGG